MLESDALEASAKAEWERCRSLSDRKSGTTWEEQTDEVKAAWRIGPTLVIGIYLAAVNG